MWIEDDAGIFKATVALTEALALHDIGNRPGASQMNRAFLLGHPNDQRREVDADAEFRDKTRLLSAS